MGFDTTHTWFHGTFSNFTEFQERFGNTNAYFGQAFYFSDSPTDVNMNYVDPESPDWSTKIEEKIEHLMSEMEMKEPDGDYDEFRVRAEAIVHRYVNENRAIVLETYLKMENPIDISDTKDRWSLSEDQDEAGEYNGEFSGEGMDLLNAIERAFLEVGVESEVSTNFRGDVFSHLLDYGGISPRDLHKKFRESPDLFVEDNNGNLVSGNNLFRNTMQKLGYDGIILDAHETYPVLVREPNVKHAIVFDPSQIRSVFAVFDPEQRASADIRKGTTVHSSARRRE
jgi:hypothetical protein